MSQCLHCASSERQTKSGRTSTGSQRYKCKECRRIYTPDPKLLGYPEGAKREAVRLYLEGTNFRRIGRVLGVNHQSVVNRVNSYHASLPAAGQAVTAPETLEMDELFTFVGSKKARLGCHESFGRRSPTTACTRPRSGSNVIESLSVLALDARRVIPGVRLFTKRIWKLINNSFR